MQCHALFLWFMYLGVHANENFILAAPEYRGVFATMGVGTGR